MKLSSNTGSTLNLRIKKTYKANSKVILAFLIAIFLFILGSILSSGFASMTHIMMVLKVSSFLGVLALAQTVVIMSGGDGIDLSIGATASAGAVIASVLINGNGAMIPLAVVAVIVLGFALGLINGLGITGLGIPSLVMTLAMSDVITGALVIFSNGSALTGGASQSLISLGTKSTLGIPNILFVWIAIIVLAVLFMTKTKFGAILMGVGSNDLTAELNGIHSKRVRCLAYAFSGAIAGLGGLFLLGYIGSAYINIGNQYVMPSVAAAVIGGVLLAGGEGNYLGVAGGAIVLTTLSAILTTLKMGEGSKQIVYGLVLIVMLVFYGKQTDEE
jgi:ribose transport system permease protein